MVTMKSYIHILLLILLSNWAFSQEAKLTATVSQTTVATGQQFMVRYTLNNRGDGFRAPNLAAFRVLSGPNQSTSMSFINGNMSAEQSYSFYLMATKEGTYTIEPATIQFNGKTIKSNLLKIEVVKGDPVPQQNNQGGSQNQQAPADLNASEYGGKDVFVKVDVNKTKVYQGEPVIATYRLYTRVGIVDNDMEKMPALTGFWSKDLMELTGNVQWQNTTVNGERYNVATLKKVMLFPLHAGKLSIDPWKMNLVIQKPVNTSNSRSIFDQFFGGGYQNVKVKVASNAMSIEALPLPEKGKPNSFDGMVGNYKMDVKTDKTEVKANEAIQLTVKISGTGNLKLIDSPKLDFPDDFEVYDPEISDDFVVKDGTLSGFREFKYLIIPRNPGKFEIDPIHYSYFNPSTKTYHELNGEVISLKINKGLPGSEAQTYNAQEQQDIKDLGNDIRYIKTTGDLSNAATNFWNTGSFFVWLSLPFLLFIVAFAYKKKQERDEDDVNKMQDRRANKLLNKYLGQAKKSLKADDKNVFYQSILSAFDNYLSHKLRMDNSQLTKENIREKLAASGVGDAVILQLEKIKEACEMAQYAPIVSSSNEALLEQASRVIQQIEKEIKNA